MNRRTVIALPVVAITLVSVVGLVVARAVFKRLPCSYLDEPLVSSPDGRWTVLARTTSCPAGPLSVTNYSVTATLAPRPGIASSEDVPVLIFEERDSAEPPQVIWAARNEVFLKLSAYGEVKTSKHEFAHISIKYVVPKWLWDRSGEADDHRREEDKRAEELYRAGKATDEDLRISLQTNQEVAQGWKNFRQWVAENATVEPDPATRAK